MSEKSGSCKWHSVSGGGYLFIHLPDNRGGTVGAEVKLT